MPQDNQKLFISTAIDYVNAAPHLGHALEKIQADVLARYNQQIGRDVFFLTGSDENSLKNVRAAEKAGLLVQDFVDKNARIFYNLKEALNLSFNNFIRTTEVRHIKGVQKLWQACQKDIYQDEYQGLYCVGCESYYTPEELQDGLCPEHQVKPELIKETNYFFKLSKYQEQIKEIIQQGKTKVIPEGRQNEVLSFVKQGLKDICVSRSQERALGWGIDVPGDSSQKIWCWFDALGNYITALGYAENSQQFQDYWQNGEVWHVIGKGISRFHAVYWLGILLSAGVKLPDKILVHGYINVNGQKMSKSLGNVINPFDLIEQYTQKIGNKEVAVDAVRYFLSREISTTEDGDFTQEKFVARYNSDLASGLGNLLARVLTLAEKLKIKNEKLKTTIQNENLEKAKEKYTAAIRDFRLNEALGAVWELIGFCDKYINDQKPWDNKPNSQQVVEELLVCLAEIAKLVEPFLPQTSAKIKNQLQNGKGESLFPRLT